MFTLLSLSDRRLYSCDNDCSYLLTGDQEMTGCVTKPRMSPSKLEETRGQTWSYDYLH